MNTYIKMVGGWQPVARVVEREKAPRRERLPTG
jgi:hypothetical protein